MEPESLQSKFPSIKQSVEFRNILPQYSTSERLKCNYRLLNCTSQEGDRIAIFKLGWSSVKEYVMFEWTGVNKKADNVVIFNELSLPHDSNEMYQMCYINGENRVCGASEPFQFVTTPFDFVKSLDSDVSSLESNDGLSKMSVSNSINLEKEVIHLKVENRHLRRSLQDIMDHVINMQKMMHFQQKEIDMLKERCMFEDGQKLRNTSDSLRILKSMSDSFDSNYNIGELESVPPFPFIK